MQNKKNKKYASGSMCAGVITRENVEKLSGWIKLKTAGIKIAGKIIETADASLKMTSIKLRNPSADLKLKPAGLNRWTKIKCKNIAKIEIMPPKKNVMWKFFRRTNFGPNYPRGLQLPRSNQKWVKRSPNLKSQPMPNRTFGRKRVHNLKNKVRVR